MILCAVLDKKAVVFGAVFTSKNEETAIREFSIACQDPQSNLNRFPEDFQLCKLANYDENQGKIMPEKVPVVLTTAQSFVTEKKKEPIMEVK